jgi:hypothetical protein
MISFSLKNYRPYRLVLAEAGPHCFGGPPRHAGAVPGKTDTPLHHFLSLDLSDPHCPVMADGPVGHLPLYYPLKYGLGGSAVQYAVLSDTEIKLLYLSDESPDDDDQQYVQVSALPASQARSIPLKYEEARILTFMTVDGYFQPSNKDGAVLDRLGRQNLISLGGRLPIPNAGDVICRNDRCEFFNRRVYFRVVATVPPIPVNGSDEFWHEFQGGAVTFCFGLCQYCGTVIAFNVAS